MRSSYVPGKKGHGFGEHMALTATLQNKWQIVLCFFTSNQ